MNSIRIFGIILAALGILALIYGGFTYVKDTHDADLGPVEFQIQEKEHVDVPLWMGIAGIVIGSGMAFYPWKKTVS